MLIVFSVDVFFLSLSMHIINRFCYEPHEKKTKAHFLALYCHRARSAKVKEFEFDRTNNTFTSYAYTYDDEEEEKTQQQRLKFEQVLPRSQRTMTE